MLTHNFCDYVRNTHNVFGHLRIAHRILRVRSLFVLDASRPTFSITHLPDGAVAAAARSQLGEGMEDTTDVDLKAMDLALDTRLPKGWTFKILKPRLS